MTDVGDLIRFGNPLIDPSTGQALAAPAAAFTVNGAPTNPTAVTLTIQKPDGTQLVYAWPTPGAGQFTLQQEAGQTGRFYADVLIDQPGYWFAKLAGSGAVTQAEELALLVRKSRIA